MSTDDYQFVDLPGTDPAAASLFLFHGTGGDERQFLDLGAQLLPGARRIAPRGDVSEAGALRYFRRRAEGQYDMQDLSRATHKLSAFVRDRIGSHTPSEIFGFGYSNGANILASVLFTAPELFDRAALLHPLIPFEPQPQPGLAGRRVLITAGRRDPICPSAATEWLAGWYRAQGADVELVWHAGGHEIAPEELQAVRGFLQA